MVLKTVTILLWFAASYAALVFFSTEWWHGVLASISLGLSIAGIGFAIQHDANHGAYSSNPGSNRLLSRTLDFLGASSYVWGWKHNVLHHTWTNIEGSDSDVELGVIGRLAPLQKRYWFHRFQQYYLWLAYGLVAPKWQIWDDFYNLATARISKHPIVRGGWGTVVGVILGKLVFAGWAIVIPLCYHPFWQVVAFSALTWGFMGIVLSVVFQLAHCVEEAEFQDARAAAKNPALPWAEHQLRTTVDFAQGNPILTWYLGGLNYQVEHHLFPRICHLHYPRIARIVRETCAEFGVPYSANPGFFSAIASHYRWLRRMGRPQAA
ncbi:MAG: acyl-CoA desaturase [Candidatus Brocadiae bacterium]|nr:acyl-CoA desaturase [Candidatus Brocadiia bacterium]